MQIKCPNCNKSFNINEDMIPSKGRLLQCGSCSNKWFFKKKIIENLNPEKLINTLTDKKLSKNGDQRISFIWKLRVHGKQSDCMHLFFLNLVIESTMNLLCCCIIFRKELQKWFYFFGVKNIN